MTPQPRPVDLYLLAHPDDDLFLRPLLSDGAVDHHIFFLTNGRVPGPVTPDQRQREATRALADVGVSQISWVGIDKDIDVYALIDQLPAAWSGLVAASSGARRVRRIVTHAWEGGHPDHDACHVLALALARRLGVEAASKTLPYYRAPVFGPVPFLVMSPLDGNGAVEQSRLSWKDAWNVIRGMRFYPSQKIPLIGLAPGTILKALVRRRLDVQPLASSRALERPHAGKLLYERRNGRTYEYVRDCCSEFLAMVAERVDNDLRGS